MMIRVYICIGLAFFLGFFLGFKSCSKMIDTFMKTDKVFKVFKRDGIFRVDTTNPEKDIFSLELECPIGSIPEKHILIFEVMNTRSQEKPFV